MKRRDKLTLYYDPEGDRITYAMMYRLVADFQRFLPFRLTLAESVVIARLELQRQRRPCGVRAYVVSEDGALDFILLLYTAYVRAIFHPDAPRPAVITPRLTYTDRLMRHPAHRVTDVLCLSSRDPNHIRGFGGFTNILLLRSDIFNASAAGDPGGWACLRAALSSVCDCPNSTLIISGDVRRRSRMFTVMYRRAARTPLPGDKVGRAAPPPDGFIAIDSRAMPAPHADPPKPPSVPELPDILKRHSRRVRPRRIPDEYLLRVTRTSHFITLTSDLTKIPT